MKIHSSLLAPVVILVFLVIVLIGNAWELPSMQKQFSESFDRAQTINMIVDGLRCRGTSNFFIKVVGEVPGIVSVTTYVQEHRAMIEYDPSQIDLEGIVRSVEKPMRLSDGSLVAPFKVLKIEN